MFKTEIEVNHIYSRILTPLPSDLEEVVQKTCRYRMEGYRFTPAYNSGGWDGYIRLYKPRAGTPRTFPTGLLPLVVAALKEHGADVSLIRSYDVNRPPSPLAGAIFADERISLRPYQTEAVDVCLSKRRGIVQLPTGTGKTVLMAEFIRQANRSNTLVLVYHSKDLLSQTANVLESYLGVDVGRVGDGKLDLKPLTVAISDRLVREIKKKNPQVIDWLKGVDVLCVDEVHHIRADTLQVCCQACPNALYRIGLSATPFRDQGDDLEIYGSISGIIYKKGLTWMVENGYLVEPELRVIFLDASMWVMDYQDEENLESSPSREFQKFQKAYIWENKKRHLFISDIVRGLVDEGYRGIVMTTNIEHGRQISELIEGSDFVYGKDPTKVRRVALDDLASGNMNVIVCTTIYNEGVDCPPASFIVPAQPHKSNVVTVQQQGRVLRPFPGKSKAVLVDIVDCGNNRWFKKQYKSRSNYYENEPVIKKNMKVKYATL